MRGTRIVDPGEPGGGHLRFVTILYGAPTERVWHAIYGRVEFYAAGMLLLRSYHRPADRVGASSRPRAAAPACIAGWPRLGRFVGVLTARLCARNRRTCSAHPAPRKRAAAAGTIVHQQRTFRLRRRARIENRRRRRQVIAATRRHAPRTPRNTRPATSALSPTPPAFEELVAKMLTMARVESGASATVSESAPASDLAECTRKTIASLETIAKLREVDVNASALPANPCTVPLSQEDCDLLLSNLLLNALQHSPQRSAVELRISNGAAIFELSVADHGDGIDPAALPHVFNRFFRGDPSRARSTGGAGLGLAICKAVVEKVDGTIELKSEQGKGTTAIVHLPRA